MVKPEAVKEIIDNETQELDRQIELLRAKKAEISASATVKAMVVLVDKLVNAKNQGAIDKARNELYPVAKAFCNSVERARKLQAEPETDENDKSE